MQSRLLDRFVDQHRDNVNRIGEVAAIWALYEALKQAGVGKTLLVAMYAVNRLVIGSKSSE